MPNLIIALVIVFGGLWLIRTFARTPPAAATGLVQKLAGAAVIGVSGLLALRGAMNIAVPVFLFGIGLVGKGAGFPKGFSWGGKRSAGKKSRVTTELLAMELDHDSGHIEGEVLSGALKGRKLSDLAEAELQALHGQAVSLADQSRALLEAWLDRHKSGWRDDWSTPGGKARKNGNGSMSKAEALAVLGLKEGAGEAEVRAAHRKLMKDLHPDHGGSDYLAAKVNAAKDVLLGT